MMKHIHFLPAALVIVFSGCSTYRQTQTPDDVYYSPGADREEYASAPANNNQNEYYSVANDQYVRMRVQDPQKWSYFDDYNTDYYGGYSPAGYNAAIGYGYGYGGIGYGGMGYGGFGISPWIGFGYWSPISYWNSYYSWNGFYNPYYGGVIVSNPKIQNASYSRVSTFNPASYTNNTYNRGNTRPSSASYTPYSYSQTIRSNYTNPYNNSYRNNNAGRPFYNQNSGSNFSTQPTRTYSAPTRSSSSFGGGSSGGGGGSRGGGGGGVSRPGR